MVNSGQQRQFGHAKSQTLPKFCRECEVRFACNGECPKHRFITTPDGEQGLNYLCAGYKKFFNHVDPYMKTMSGLLRARKAPANIMGMLPLRPVALDDFRVSLLRDLRDLPGIPRQGHAGAHSP
jgi:uncharacterized protein